jgi:hypothetical protein
VFNFLSKKDIYYIEEKQVNGPPRHLDNFISSWLALADGKPLDSSLAASFGTSDRSKNKNYYISLRLFYRLAIPCTHLFFINLLVTLSTQNCK